MSFATCWRRLRASDVLHAGGVGLRQAWACARPERTAQDVAWGRVAHFWPSQLCLSLLVLCICILLRSADLREFQTCCELYGSACVVACTRMQKHVHTLPHVLHSV